MRSRSSPTGPRWKHRPSKAAQHAAMPAALEALRAELQSDIGKLQAELRALELRLLRRLDA